MKRATVALFLAAVAGAALTLPAGDAAAYDLDIEYARIGDNGGLSLYFTEKYLYRYESYRYRATARVDATWVCINPAGEPLGGPQHRESVYNVWVDDEETFRSDRYGDLEGRMSLWLDERPSLYCPGRSRRELAYIRYHDIRVSRRGESDTTGSVWRYFYRLW